MRAPAVLLATISVVAACGGDPPPGRTYYERTIEPILIQSCAGNTSGCHRTNTDDPFDFAAGNFDVSSFDNVQKRRDVLQPFGSYPVPLLLIKAVGPGQLQMAYGDEFRDVMVNHAGGNIFQVGSDAYLTLLTWTENGATENGLRPASPPRTGEGACTPTLPPNFDPVAFAADPVFVANSARFDSDVAPVLATCNSGNCHGAPQSDFFITCGDTAEQRAFNFSQAWAFVDAPVDESQILRVPLAAGAGGGPHTGGDRFSGMGDADYQRIHDWAEAVGPRLFGVGEPGKEFFRDNVQPMLYDRGCGFAACHSPSAGNDFKMRPSSHGFVSAITLEKNYETLLSEFMAFEMPDARRGRAVAKVILPGDGGISHRGGPVLGEGLPASCPAVYDPATATPFCTLQEWVNVERAERIAAGELAAMPSGGTVPLVYVDRAASHVAGPLEFDTYQGGSDLRVAPATLGALGQITGVGGSTSLLGGCAGLDPSTADVSGPAVRYDGTTVAFAARSGAADPLGIWLVEVDGANCRRVTPAAPDVNFIKIHNFDPAWAPDGNGLVFASTRGGAHAGGVTGPVRSRKLFLPASDLWRMGVDGSNPEQLTFLTNSELNPNVLREGRIIMTTEKASGSLYQLSGRRLNWDRTDYHPLLAQRHRSPYGDPDDASVMTDSIGYDQATDIREDLDGNLLFIASDAGARGGAGTLAIFNRSIGPFEAGRTDPGYLRSATFPDPAATGRVGAATDGAYRGPHGMPDGRIMVSYAAVTGDLGTVTSLDWDIVAIDPRTGIRTTLIGGAGAQVDAVLAIKAAPRKPYLNRRQLVFGGSVDEGQTGAGRAVVHMPDAPLIFTLLTGNLRRGRPVDGFRSATQLVAYAEVPPPAGTTMGNQPNGVYESRVEAGRADLADDGSVKFNAPAGVGVVIELRDGDNNVLVNMGEEHQLAPGEMISMGIRADLFDAVCGSCHGSVTGSELDVAVTPDALTGASQSMSKDGTAQRIGP
ncbi:MAG: PD40 domain-containing protein [Myxococcales bacterium]|nr:PD40 domain-containing protein [Myxococcales bacterium]